MPRLRTPGQLCAQCKTNRVRTYGAKFCSPTCANVRFRRLKPKCQAPGCPNRVRQWHNTYCSKRCAWLQRQGLEAGRKGRVTALEVLRKQYIVRLRETLKGVTNVVQIWKLAYARGYQACYQGYLRKIRKGEIVVVKERRADWNTA